MSFANWKKISGRATLTPNLPISLEPQKGNLDNMELMKTQEMERLLLTK